MATFAYVYCTHIYVWCMCVNLSDLLKQLSSKLRRFCFLRQHHMFQHRLLVTQIHIVSISRRYNIHLKFKEKQTKNHITYNHIRKLLSNIFRLHTEWTLFLYAFSEPLDFFKRNNNNDTDSLYFLLLLSDKVTHPLAASNCCVDRLWHSNCTHKKL